MNQILGHIASRAGETSVRARFADYVIRFVRLAAKYEEDQLGNTTIGWPTIAFKSSATGLGSGLVTQGEVARELAAFSPRIEAWRQSRSYHYFRQVRCFFRQKLTYLLLTSNHHLGLQRIHEHDHASRH